MKYKEEQECCCLCSSGDESVSSAIESDDRPHLTSLPETLSPAAGGYSATASAMFSTTSSRSNVVTMTIAQIRVVLTSLDTRGYIENHRQRTGEG